MDSSPVVRLSLIGLIVGALIQNGRAAEGADKYSLKPTPKVGYLQHVEVALQVGGDLKLVDDGKEITVPMSVVANLKFDEQLLALDADMRPARSARYYDEARAVIKVDKGGEKPSLDPRHRLIGVECRAKQPPVLYCPADALSREELDLIDIQASSLLIDQVLPTDPVALGGSWKISSDVLSGLLALDAASWSDVEGMLGQVTDGVAEVAAGGSVSGAVGGVATEIELKIKLKFDLKEQHINQFAMLVKEKRVVGHVGPGLDTVAKVLVSLKPLARSEGLTDTALKSIPVRATAEQIRLRYASQRGAYGFDYDRRWYLTNDDSKLAVWRMLDRGELVAQCNMSPLTGKKKPLTLAEFQADVEKSLGKNFGQFVKAGQSVNEAGYTVFRVVAHGTVSELPIEWVYYLLQDEQGRGVSLAFTYEQQRAERFAASDQALVAGLRLVEAQSPTAAKPATPATSVQK